MDDKAGSKTTCESLLYQSHKAGWRHCPPDTPLSLPLFQRWFMPQNPPELKHLRRLLLQQGQMRLSALKKKHKHDTYLLDGTFMLCYPCLHSRMTMWVSHPVAKYLFLLMLVWHFKTFFIGKIKSWGDWHCERTHFQTLLFCTSDKLCRHPWDSSHLYHFASLSSWIFRTTHCRWSQKLGGIRTMNFRTQTSRLSYWGNVIHLLGSTKKVFKLYF